MRTAAVASLLAVFYFGSAGPTLNAFVFKALKDAAYLGRVVGEDRYEREAARLGGRR